MHTMCGPWLCVSVCVLAARVRVCVRVRVRVRAWLAPRKLLRNYTQNVDGLEIAAGVTRVIQVFAGLTSRRLDVLFAWTSFVVLAL
jgi:hypothetical protein